MDNDLTTALQKHIHMCVCVLNYINYKCMDIWAIETFVICAIKKLFLFTGVY